MSDWQKVRLTFTDADGSGVSAVMWRDPYGSSVYGNRDIGPDVWIGWSDDYQGVKVEPIRELPTGVGAVIKVVKPIFTKSRDLYCHTGNGWWTNGEGSDISAHAEYNGFDDLDWPYEILSEGIQL